MAREPCQIFARGIEIELAGKEHPCHRHQIFLAQLDQVNGSFQHIDLMSIIFPTQRPAAVKSGLIT